MTSIHSKEAQKMTRKIPAILLSALALGAVAAPGSALAMAPVGKATKGAPTIHVAPVVHTALATQAGGAGVPGYDDDTCQGLLSAANAELMVSEAMRQQYSPTGYNSEAESMKITSEITYQQVSDNCMVID
jgi:hypothetical protein